MSLLEFADSIPGSGQSQAFGPVASSGYIRQPAMYALGAKAYWNYIAGWRFYSQFHPGIDRYAPEGTPIHALESGIVSWANLGTPTNPSGTIDGIRVEVEIRPGTRYGFNHLSQLEAAKGDAVHKGDIIGYVGSTGAATGPHAHEYVSHVEIGIDGIPRTLLYDSSLFRPGGVLSRVAWIQPPYTPPENLMPARYATFDPPCQVSILANVNIRSGPGFDYPVIVHTERATDPIWLSGFVSGDAYDVGTGEQSLWYSYWLTNPNTSDPFDGRWVYFAKPLCRITKRG